MNAEEAIQPWDRPFCKSMGKIRYRRGIANQFNFREWSQKARREFSRGGLVYCVNGMYYHRVPTYNRVRILNAAGAIQWLHTFRSVRRIVLPETRGTPFAALFGEFETARQCGHGSQIRLRLFSVR